MSLDIFYLFSDFIGELSDHIGEDWKVLARSLGLKKTDIDAISHDNQGSLKEQIYQFFEKWKQRNGRNATVQQLVDGLRKAKLFDQLENLQEAGFISKGLWLPDSSSKFNGFMNLQLTSTIHLICKSWCIQNLNEFKSIPNTSLTRALCVCKCIYYIHILFESISVIVVSGCSLQFYIGEVYLSLIPCSPINA